MGTRNSKYASLLVSDVDLEGSPDRQSVKKCNCGTGDDILEECMREER